MPALKASDSICTLLPRSLFRRTPRQGLRFAHPLRMANSNTEERHDLSRLPETAASDFFRRSRYCAIVPSSISLGSMWPKVLVRIPSPLDVPNRKYSYCCCVGRLSSLKACESANLTKIEARVLGAWSVSVARSRCNSRTPSDMRDSPIHWFLST